jgi:preprotein translocase subunit SecG
LDALLARATELVIFAWMVSTLILTVLAHPYVALDLFGALNFSNALVQI